MFKYCLIYKDNKIIGYTKTIHDAINICKNSKDLFWILTKDKKDDIIEMKID